MSIVTLEPGETHEPRPCECCGKKSHTVHGFVYENGDAHAVYFAAWSEGHQELGVTMAIALGEWGDESGPADRYNADGLSVPTSRPAKPRERKCSRGATPAQSRRGFLCGLRLGNLRPQELPARRTDDGGEAS